MAETFTFEPTHWRVLGPGLPAADDFRCVEIVERRQRDGRTMFAVVRAGSVLARDGEWEYEPQPSSRDDAFLVRTRFSTFDEALAALVASPAAP